MKLSKLSREDASTVAVSALGLDANVIDLLAPESLAALLRRAASFMCPTSPALLVNAVLEVLKPFHGDEFTRTDLVNLLERLVASGDLLELGHEGGRSMRLLYLAPPAYVERAPGTYLLMGVRPFGAPLIGDEMAEAMDHEGHARILTIDPAGAERELGSRGLQRIPRERWVSSPGAERAVDYIERHRARLDLAVEAGQLDGLALLDPTIKVSYYRGRWRSPDIADSGDYVVRRRQAYGADLWCLVRFQAGKPQRLLDFPVNDPLVPGRDEAWRYQAAVDAVYGRAQRFRLLRNVSPTASAIMDFFSPLPGFAERYVQFTGLPVGKTPGALFSFRLPATAVHDVMAFLTDMLWMTEEDTGGN